MEQHSYKSRLSVSAAINVMCSVNATCRSVTELMRVCLIAREDDQLGTH